MKPQTISNDVITSMTPTNFSVEVTPHTFQLVINKLYENPIRALIQELICNAWDAQQTIGIPTPIQVHFPTDEEPYFEVTDHGPGLSINQIENVYTVLFKSTKNDNATYGGYGLGAKSPFAYTDTFTIISSHDNTQTIYSLFIGPQGIPQYALADAQPTTALNGLTVTVPVQTRDIETFQQVRHDLAFMAPLITSNIPITPPKCLWQCEAGGFYKISNCSGVFIKIKDLLYELDSSHDIVYLSSYYTLKWKSAALILNAEIGELDLTPSKETFIANNRSYNLITEQTTSIYSALRANLQTHIDQYASLEEAFIHTYDLHASVIALRWFIDTSLTYRRALLPSYLPISVGDALLYDLKKSSVHDVIKTRKDSPIYITHPTNNLHILYAKPKTKYLPRKLQAAYKQEPAAYLLIADNPPDLHPVIAERIRFTDISDLPIETPPKDKPIYRYLTGGTCNQLPETYFYVQASQVGVAHSIYRWLCTQTEFSSPTEPIILHANKAKGRMTDLMTVAATLFDRYFRTHPYGNLHQTLNRLRVTNHLTTWNTFLAHYPIQTLTDLINTAIAIPYEYSHICELASTINIDITPYDRTTQSLQPILQALQWLADHHTHPSDTPHNIINAILAQFDIH